MLILLFLFGKDADINSGNQSLVDKQLIEKKYHSYSGVY